MKLTVHRHYLEIKPEGPQDEAYIEEVLGLTRKGDSLSLVREHCAGGFGLLGLRTMTRLERLEAWTAPGTAGMSVKTVFVFPNGMVAVCDENGKQITELQGKFEDIREKIAIAADSETEFNGWPGGKPETCV